MALPLLLTFAPVEFIHPIRVRRLRPLTLAVTLAWSLFSLLTLFADLNPPVPVLFGLAVTSIYLASIGAILQAARVLRRP